MSCLKQPPEMFYEKSVLENIAKFTGKHMCQNLCFNKVYEIYGIFKNTFFTEHLWTTASELSRHLLEMHSFTLEVKAVVSLLLKAIPKIKIHVTPAHLHLKAICFKLSRWF